MIVPLGLAEALGPFADVVVAMANDHADTCMRLCPDQEDWKMWQHLQGQRLLSIATEMNTIEVLHMLIFCGAVTSFAARGLCVAVCNTTENCTAPVMVDSAKVNQI